MKKDLIVLQEGGKDCGAACLLSIVRYFGGDISLERLINLTKTDKEGTNFYNISRASLEVGLQAKAFVSDADTKLIDIDVPFLAQVNNNGYMHFVIVYKVFETKVLIMDPSKGKTYMDTFDFTNIWTGNLMLFEKINELPVETSKKVLNKILLSALFKNKKIICFLLSLSIIYTILSCLSSFYSQVVFDRIIDTTVNNLTIITILFSILYLIKIITNYFRCYLIIYLNQKIDVSIILNTFTKIILFPYSYYKNKTTGELLSKINDLFSIKSFISKIIVSLFLDTITFLASSIIIYFINSKIFFSLIVLSIIYIFIILIFNFPIQKYTKLVQENNTLVNSYIVEKVGAYESIKNLNIEDNTILSFSKKYSYLLNVLYQKDKIENTMLFMKNILADIGMLCVNYLIIRLIMKNDMTIGNYMNITLLASYLIYPLHNIMGVLGEYNFIKNALTRANNLLSVSEEKIYDKHLLNINGNIRITNLTYSYNNKKDILKNINLYINDSDRVLILGSSGSGKSTLLKILYKYYQVPRGSICFNNYDINDYSLSDIRNSIAYVSQNEKLFMESIKDNIILKRNINEEEFQKIVRITYIDDIVKDNILGYDYTLEENGSNLSGGQRQRIILARALLKNSKIIMIDEGLNEVDIKLERKILINIFREYKDKTFIIISHRRSNEDLYNRLIKFEDGIVKNYERG